MARRLPHVVHPRQERKLAHDLPILRETMCSSLPRSIVVKRRDLAGDHSSVIDQPRCAEQPRQIRAGTDTRTPVLCSNTTSSDESHRAALPCNSATSPSLATSSRGSEASYVHNTRPLPASMPCTAFAVLVTSKPWSYNVNAGTSTLRIGPHSLTRATVQRLQDTF